MRFGLPPSSTASPASRWRPSCRCISSRSDWRSKGEDRLEGFLRWSDRPVVKLAETILVFLLAIHMLGGLRLLVLENFGWLDWQKQIALLAAGLSAIAAFAFLLQVL